MDRLKLLTAGRKLNSTTPLRIILSMIYIYIYSMEDTFDYILYNILLYGYTVF